MRRYARAREHFLTHRISDNDFRPRRAAGPDDPIQNILDASARVRNLEADAPVLTQSQQEPASPQPNVGLRFKALSLGIPLLLLGALAVIGGIVWIALAARDELKAALSDWQNA